MDITASQAHSAGVAKQLQAACARSDASGVVAPQSGAKDEQA